MSDHFITNRKDNNLSTVIQDIFSPNKTASLDFLVGYFYFSGIEEIYENIQDKEMRILVGMDMDQELQNQTYRFNEYAKKKKSSRQDIRYQNYDYLVDLFNNTDYFESKKKQEAFKIYFEKIKNGTLEIRKTKDPSHAKMYIFTYKEEDSENGRLPGTVITGSSNLTLSGLTAQNEINVRFHRKTEYKEATKIFENLWKDAIVLANQSLIEEFYDKVIKHTWYEKVYSPYLFFLRVMHEYFSLDMRKHIKTPHSITRGSFFNLKYQEDAIRIGIETIQQHNGVIVADVVGLGKSIIASAIAHNLGLRTIIIAPPHLVPQWEDYQTDFAINRAKVFSRGVIDKALDYYLNRVRENEECLIIIDEAHNYRNEYTIDYDKLKNLCAGNKVMLLTATPFNNQPSDIFSMIKLFQIPTKSTLQTVDNLGYKFRELINAYKTLKKQQKDRVISDTELKLAIDSIASQIRTIISPLIVRRSRIDLADIPVYKEDLEKQGVEFSKVKDPEALEYNLGSLKDLYIHTLQHISHNPDMDKKEDRKPRIDMYDNKYSEDNIEEEVLSHIEFRAARYKPITYVKAEFEEKVKKTVENAGFEYHLFKGAQRNLARFMRTLLVHRFESSQNAFKISLNNMLHNCLNILAWSEKRNAVPIFKKGMLPDIEELYNSTADVIPEMIDDELDDAIKKLNTRGMFEIKTEYLDDEFFDDLQHDIDLLQDLKDHWDKVEIDPKIERFIEILKEQTSNDPERKIVVFSQFADTINYLGDALKKEGLPVFVYTGAVATQRNKEIIKANFDAGYIEHKQQNDYQILVATDAISEGYNLHRAGTIFNYDIPYNPTKVIQRVGRINRINKKMFDYLYIYNYFPTAIGETETRTKQISTLKMDMIHAIMGEDTKILTSDEEIQSHFVEEYRRLNSESEQKSWDTDYRALYNQLEGSKEMKEAKELPLRAKTCRLFVDKDNKGVLLFAKKGNDYVFKYATDKDTVHDLSPQDAFKLLKCDEDEKGYAVSDDFEDLYNAAKASLYITKNDPDIDRTKRDALAKIRIIIQGKTFEDKEYLEDLKTIIEYDAISGYALRAINRLKNNEYHTLPGIISNDYIQKMLRSYDSIDEVTETLILAEEFNKL